MPSPAKNTKSCSNYYPPDPARTLHGRSRLPRLLESARPAGIRTAARRGLPRRSRGGSKDGMPEGFLDDFQEGANIRLNVARRTRASGTTSRVRHEPATQRKGRGRSRRGHTRRAVGCHDRRGARSTGRPLALNSNRPQSIHNSLGDCRCQMESLGRQKYPLRYRRAFPTKVMPAYQSDASSVPGDHEVNIPWPLSTS
jgi:hypothetical protein